MCVVSGTIFDHGLPVCLGPDETDPCCYQRSGDERFRSTGDHRPERDQKGTITRIEGHLRQFRWAAHIKSATCCNYVTCRKGDLVFIELQLCHLSLVYLSGVFLLPFRFLRINRAKLGRRYFSVNDIRGLNFGIVRRSFRFLLWHKLTTIRHRIVKDWPIGYRVSRLLCQLSH